MCSVKKMGSDVIIRVLVGVPKFKGFNMVYLNLFVKYIHPCVSGSTVIQVKEEALNSEHE